MTMKMRRLGTSGLKVSEVGLGCNNFGMRIDQQATQGVVDAALDAGITLFDTADIYGGTKSEEFLGKALGKRRQDIVLATKFGMRIGDDPRRMGGSRRWIMRAVEDSLTRLGTDYIDLYQIHRPDESTPIEETLAALDDLVRAGKVRYLGHSNFSGWQIADADWTARAAGSTPFISAQNQYSLLQRDVETEVLPACEHFGLGFLPFFPLDSGLLSGKYKRGEAAPESGRLSQERYKTWLADADWDTIEALTAFGAKSGHSLLEVAIAGLASRPAVTSVIAGATSPEQVKANAAAAAWELSTDEVAALDEILD
jgi:aryl-alcohol dehydrogenase-like predicted oxidoreductase